MAANQKTYRPRFFRDWLFNPILWVIFVIVVSVIVVVMIGLGGDVKTGLAIAIAIWFLIIFFLWGLAALFDKVILTDEFIKYGGKRVKLSDIEKIVIGETGPSVIAKVYPAVPQPAELPQAVLKGRGKLDLPRWLMSAKFFDDLKKRAPEIEISLPKLKPYLWSLAASYLWIAIATIVGFGGGLAYLLLFLKSLPFTYLGNFSFVNFFKNYPFIEKIAIGGGGLAVILIFLFLSLGLFLIYDKEWRKFFFKLLTFLVFLHLLGWLLYYFGILK